MPTQKNFWFNVNAELIIYGATEPDAKVTLGGHEDQTAFRRHVQFPLSRCRTENMTCPPWPFPPMAMTRARPSLKFSRETEYLGDVGAHPQDPSLKPPLPENL